VKFGDYSISGYTKFESVSDLDFGKSHYIMELRTYGKKNLSFHVVFYESVCDRYSLVVPLRDRFNLNPEFEYDTAIYSQGQHSFKPTFSKKPGGTTQAINPKLFPGDIGNYIAQPALGEYNYVSDVYGALNDAFASRIDSFETKKTHFAPSKPVFTKFGKEVEMYWLKEYARNLFDQVNEMYDIESDLYDVQTLIQINGLEGGKLDVQLDIKVSELEHSSVGAKLDHLLEVLPTLHSSEFGSLYRDLQEAPKNIILEMPKDEELELEIANLRAKSEKFMLDNGWNVNYRIDELERDIDKATEWFVIKREIVRQHNWYPKAKALKARYDAIRPHSKNNSSQVKEDPVTRFHEAVEKLAMQTIHASHNNENPSLVAWKLCNKINDCEGKIPAEDIEWANSLIKSSGCLTDKARARWNFTSTKETPEQCFTGLMYITRNLE
jgi:hypothetical protein